MVNVSNATECFGKMMSGKPVDSMSPSNRRDNTTATPSTSAPQGIQPKEIGFSDGGQDTNKRRSTPSSSDQPQVASPNQRPLDVTTPPLDLQPQPGPHEQLVSEAAYIHSGLVKIEQACVSFVSLSKNPKHTLDNDQWETLIVLHRVLLEKHSDLFLFCCHPMANEGLRPVAKSNENLFRMWKYGIQDPLYLLQKRSGPSEYMLRFIQLAYDKMELLYANVPDYRKYWAENLGDIARYGLAFDIKHREHWRRRARIWYSFTSAKAPTIGRFYHHLAIINSRDPVRQMYYFAKSLCAVIPYDETRENIRRAFIFTLGLPTINATLIRINSLLFFRKKQELLQPYMEEYKRLLDAHIQEMAKGWLKAGYYTAITICCSLLGYGLKSNYLMRAISQPQTGKQKIAVQESPGAEAVPDEIHEQALKFAMEVFEIVACRFDDPYTLPFLHIFLVFIRHLGKYPSAMVHIQGMFPWELCATMLNHVLHACDSGPREGALKKDPPGTLPEDVAMRGLVFAEGYFPSDNEWFENPNEAEEEEEEEEKQLSMRQQRRQRILWLGKRISHYDCPLIWDETESDHFRVARKQQLC